jgi:outer membrane cobalamin receptor
MALNDPSTGVADVADLPLVLLDRVTVRPGADPVGQGSGAIGGVLALTTATAPAVMMQGGAFGAQLVEGLWARQRARTRWQVAASMRRARNDFRFVNDAGATPSLETRVNNDERRGTVSVGMQNPRLQWVVVASQGERGMVGPANVRAADEDRMTSSRVFARVQGAVGPTLISSGLRLFTLAYRDRSRPGLDMSSRAWVSETEWRGVLQGRRIQWRIGGAMDALTGSGNLVQQRRRGFTALAWARDEAQPITADLAVRTDVVERNGAQPSVQAGIGWRMMERPTGSHLQLRARMAQAVRVPTLYDLYFSSPQRLMVRALAPEIVPFDLSLGGQAVWAHGAHQLTLDASLVARETRDAIIWFPGNFGWSPANVGRERLRGVEAHTAWSGTRGGMSVWTAIYGSTLHSGALTIPTPYIPTVSHGVQAQWAVGRHTLSGNTRYQGRRPFSAGPRDAGFELPAVTLLDLSLARRQRLSHMNALVTFSLDNVTAVRWQSVRGFPMPGRQWIAALTLAPR